VTDTAAYVDTSWIIAIALKERGYSELKRRLEGFTDIYSANLLEAELLATLTREGVALDSVILEKVSWVLPVRPLRREIETVLASGFVRGADCWHLASALYAADTPGDFAFLTLDRKQLRAARALGFRN
jgi:predicted nucleic acid-binding protein